MMQRWQNWGKPQWKPQQAEPASMQVKADIQEIINKHQAAALLEANDNIRMLKEQREAHKALVKNQENTIHELMAQVKKLQEEETQKRQNEKQERERQHEHDRHENCQLQEEIEQLKRQLKQRDDIIDQLQQQQQQEQYNSQSSNAVSPERSPTSAELSTSNHSPDHLLSKSLAIQDEQSREIQSLESTVKSLTEKTEEQEHEIEKLQNIIKEFEAFYAQQNNNVSETEEPGLEILQEESFDASETSEHKEGDSNDQLLDEDYSERSLPTIPESPIQSLSPSSSNQKQRMTLNGNQLVLLISTMPIHRKVAQNQSRLETILQEYLNLSSSGNGEVQILDGCDRDPASINLRNDLFRISGLRAVYPQLFLVNFATNDISFVGDFDAIVELHDAHMFAAAIGLTPA
ncbi:expressed unknown protein [Seminavis robusta]|uniref:Uncharacterized protein n=1 Tax=Seminavis robusta TaxID=568900 RepID=A0A9N8EF97_9STRA|nr:expressed unknown protein [Seminavis robusta]|eukprot:Sro859_g211970.1 n/a (404) ;mRNA; f:17796-19007